MKPGEGINFIKQKNQRHSGVTSSTNKFNFIRPIAQVLRTSLAMKTSLKKYGKTWSSTSKNDLSMAEMETNIKTINIKNLNIEKNKDYDKQEGDKALTQLLKMLQKTYEQETKHKENKKFGSEFRNREENFSLTKQEEEKKKTESMYQMKKSKNKLRTSNNSDFKSISSISKKKTMIPVTKKANNMINKIEEKPREEEEMGVSQKEIRKSTQKIFHMKKDEAPISRPKSKSKNSFSGSQAKPIRLTHEPLIPKKMGTFIDTESEINPASLLTAEPQKLTNLISQETQGFSINVHNFEESKTLSEMGSMPMKVIQDDASFNLTNNTGITPGISVLKTEISPDLKDAIQGNYAGGSSRIVEPNSNTGAISQNTRGKNNIDSDLWFIDKKNGKQDMEQLFKNNNMNIQGINFSGNPSNLVGKKFNNLGISSDNIRGLVENLADSSQREIEKNQNSKMNLTEILETKPGTFQKTEHVDNMMSMDKTSGFDKSLGGLLSQGKRTSMNTQNLNNLLSDLNSKNTTQNNIQFSRELNELQRDMIKKKIDEQNLTVNSGNVIHEVHSSQATGGTSSSNNTGMKKSDIFEVGDFGVAGRQSVIPEDQNEDFEGMDMAFKKKRNESNLLVESNLPSQNETILSLPNQTQYQNSHLLDKTDNFVHSQHMKTYNLGSLASLNKTNLEHTTAGSRREHVNPIESTNIDEMLDNMTEGGHSKAMKRHKTIEEIEEEKKNENFYNHLEKEIGEEGNDFNTLGSKDLQNLAKQNAEEMGDFNSMNLGAFRTNSNGDIYKHLQTDISGMMNGFDDDNKVNMTMNMTLNNTMNNTMNMTQMSGLHPVQGGGLGVDSTLDMVQRQMKTNNSVVSKCRWNESGVDGIKGGSRFDSNANDSFNLVLGGPDLNNDLTMRDSDFKDNDLVVKMSNNDSMHFLKKDDYFKNRFGTNNNSSKRHEYSVLKDDEDDAQIKGMSQIHRLTSREEYGTNQSHYHTIKNKFESNNIYNSNYADSQYRGKFGDEPENMNCGPELKDMEIEYPELNTKGYRLTDSSINMGNPMHNPGESSMMENSKIIGGKKNFKMENSFNIDHKDLSAMGLLSQTSASNDQQKTIVNKLTNFNFNKGTLGLDITERYQSNPDDLQQQSFETAL
jgi:hypothetical protein